MYLSSFMQLARQRDYWYPPRLARILLSVTCNIHRQVEICRILALPEFRSIASLHPVCPFKYLSRCYLVRGLTAAERAQCFLHHYRYLQAHLDCRVLQEALQRDTALIDLREGGISCVVTMGPPADNALWEGELVLGLWFDGIPVYSLQFAIVPGWILRSQERHAFVILRIQGVKGRYGQIRDVTRTLHDVAPPALLVAALVGIAKAWDIRHLGGISAASQYARRDPESPALIRTYDEFFASLGASRVSADFFSTPIPLEDKAIEEINNGHRARTRKKRAFKQMVADEVSRRIVASSWPRESIEVISPAASAWTAAQNRMAG